MLKFSHLLIRINYKKIKIISTSDLTIKCVDTNNGEIIYFTFFKYNECIGTDELIFFFLIIYYFLSITQITSVSILESNNQQTRDVLCKQTIVLLDGNIFFVLIV